jgi:uncharacterized iron-regulated membrane protein
MTFRFGQKAEAPVTILIQEPKSRNPRPRSELQLDPVSGAVVKWEPYSSQSAGRRARAIVRPLHTGEVAGILGQLLAFVASGGAALLVWTGLALAWRRLMAFRARRAAESAPSPVELSLEQGETS